MLLVQARAALALPLLALTLAACQNSSSQSPKPLTAAEILNKPEQANVKDAHFTLTAHVVSGSVSFDASGDGVIVVKPQQASKFTMQTVVQGVPLKFQEIIVAGKEYDLTPDNPRWTVRPANSANPGSFKGKDAKLLGVDILSNGKAWHISAIDANGNPFEAWVRESDGYPLKYSSNSQGTSFIAIFDHFNTGAQVTAPPSSDIQQ
jgi:hypothetical protein